MLLVTPAHEARERARLVSVHGRDYTIAEYIGAAPKRGHYVPGNEANDNGLPQGFLVDQPPHAVTPPHFHEPNQFQVFVDGIGRMGAHAAAPLTVQYANGHTPYGPIVASETGVRYFTLRQRWDPGAKYLPESRHLLRKGNQRTRLKAGIHQGTIADRRARTGAELEVVFPAEADGLAAWMLRLGPDGRASLPEAAMGGGQYVIVTAGSMRHEAAELDRLSTIYVTAEEASLPVQAGSDGLDLLVLQFPRPGETLAGGASRLPTA